MFLLVNVVLNPVKDYVMHPALPHALRCRHPDILPNASQLAPAITQQGQWYRLLTPVVLHGSFTHLAVNSMSFSSVGPVVRELFKNEVVCALLAWNNERSKWRDGLPCK